LSKIVSFEDVSYQYEGVNEYAVKDVNLEINKGEFVLLMGASGSGKSTLCQAMNGVIPHVVPGKLKGKISVDGYDTTRLEPSSLSKFVGMVFQDPEIQLFSLVVEDEVAMSLENRAVPREEMRSLVDWALGVTGMDSLRLSSTIDLSGGQKQRLATAAALASGAEIIILDEPTAYLDNEGTRAILNVIRDLCREKGKTVILVEHKVEQTLQFADRVIVMSRGKVVKDGPPKTVFSDLATMKSVGVRLPAALELAIELNVAVPNVPLTMEELRRLVPEEKLLPLVSSKLPRDVATGGPPAVQLENVSLSYGAEKRVLRDVSLKISAGEYVAILGRNGAGKSSLATLIMGLNKPTSGRVIVDGVDTRRASVAQMARKVGFLMQNPDHQLFTESVREELAFGPRKMGLSDSAVDSLVLKAIELTGLTSLEERNPYDLSMGQRLRLALACALILSPPILLLDEPTIGQDLVHLTPLMNQVAELNRSGRTVIMITHDSHLASLHSRRTVFLDEGEVLADGPTRETLGNEELTSRCGVDAAPLPRLLIEAGKGKVKASTA